MKKHLLIPVRMKRSTLPDWDSLVIEFSDESISDLCAGLFLLKEGLITSLSVSEKSGNGKLNIRTLTDNDQSQVTWEANTAQIKLNENDFEYCSHFFLKYYRDGIAEVDHIDIEYAGDDSGAALGYIVMKVSRYHPPGSAEELRQLLNS